MSSKRYSEDHEWIILNTETNIATLGISNYAQQHLGDIVYIELPTLNTTVTKGQEIAVIESAKVSSDIYSPIPGTIVEVNNILEDNLTLLNNSPQDEGWICKIAIDTTHDINTLMTEKEYSQFIS